MSGALPVKLLIRQWLRDQQAPGLPRDRMQELLRQLGSASAESHVTLRWEGWILQHYQSRLWLQREADIVSCPGLSWDPAQPLDLGPRLGTLSLRSPRARPGWRLRVEARRGGEKIACLPGGGHRSVKQILQESHVPPWLRTSVPILWLEDRVVAVGPLAMDNGFRSELEEQGFTLAWNPRDPLLKAVFTACRDDRG